MKTYTAPFAASPCQCVKTHTPRPLEVEKHHIFPQSEQIKLYGKVIDHTTVPLCDIAHKNVHVALTRWLRREECVLHNKHQRDIAMQGYNMIREANAKEDDFTDVR